MKQQKHLNKTLFFIISFLLVSLAYIILISNELPNTRDGLWHGINYQSFSWEYSIGRWLWPFASSSLYNNIAPEPFISSLSLALFVLGACFIIQMFDLWEHKYIYLISLGITINVTVCACLSYLYQSPIFGASFLTSILAVWSVTQLNKKENIYYKLAGIIISTFFIVCTLALYQTHIGCTCLLMLAWLIYLLSHEKNWKNIAFFAFQSVFSFICGCLIYDVLWKYELIKYGIEAGSYEGANNLSIIHIIESLPERIRLSYYSWDQFFSCKTPVKYNALADNRFVFLLYLLFLAVIILVIMNIISNAANVKWGLIRAILALLLFALFPIASCVFYLLAPDIGFFEIQMTIPLMINIPILICLLPNQIFKTKISAALYGGCKKLCLLFTMIIIYGNYLQVSVDQHLMLQCKRTTLALMDRIISDIEINEYPNLDKQFIFLGRPSDNPLYRKDPLWDKGNDYARYGDLFINELNLSYNGLLRDGGYNLAINWDNSFRYAYEQMENVINMPAYPEKGYYQIIDDNIIVKVSK